MYSNDEIMFISLLLVTLYKLTYGALVVTVPEEKTVDSDNGIEDILDDMGNDLAFSQQKRNIEYGPIEAQSVSFDDDCQRCPRRNYLARIDSQVLRRVRMREMRDKILQKLGLENQREESVPPLRLPEILTNEASLESLGNEDSPTRSFTRLHMQHTDVIVLPNNGELIDYFLNYSQFCFLYKLCYFRA